ncbi:MAG: DUF455 family protein, partial [Pseudomonadota bacterium]
MSRRTASAWRGLRADGALAPVGTASPPDFPARPERPMLKEPREMPRRRGGSAAGRTAMLHAIAH